MTVEREIGKRIRAWREANDLTQAEVGVRLGEQFNGKPWTRQAVSNAESGGRSFTAVETLAICQMIGCSPDALLGWRIELGPDRHMSTSASATALRQQIALEEVKACRRMLNALLDDREWRIRSMSGE